MYCSKCGKEISQSEQFCSNCGAKNSQKNNKYTEMLKNVNKKSFVKYLIPCALVIAIIAAIVNARNTVNLNNYVEITYNGYEGYGTAEAKIDWKSFHKKYGDRIKYSRKANQEYGNLLELYSPEDALESCVDISLDSYTELSNGDTLTMTWLNDPEISELFNLKFKFKADTFKVKGLSPIDSFNPFDDLLVSFERPNPYTQVTIDYKGNIFSTDDFTFGKSKPINLTNGDVITVYLNDDADTYIKKYGVAPVELKREYTVNSSDKFISSISDINSEFKEKIDAQLEDELTSLTSGWSDKIEFHEWTALGDYLLVAKNQPTNNDYFLNPKNGFNKYGKVYKISSTATYKGVSLDVNAYVNFQLSDVNVDGEGNVVNDLTYFDIPAFTRFDTKLVYGSDNSDYHMFTYPGYESLEDLKKNIIDANVSNYTYEWNIKE